MATTEIKNTASTEVISTTANATEATVTAPAAAVTSTPTPVPAVNKVVVKAVPKVEVTQKPTLPTDFEGMVDELRKGGSVTTRAFIASVDRYTTAMKPGKLLTPEEGNREQYAFWCAIRGLVNNVPQPEFSQLWNLLLAFYDFGKNDVFHERFVCRFSDQWVQPQNELDAFQRTINLIRITYNRNTRDMGLRQLDINRTLEKGYSEEGRNKLLAFYGR